MIKELACAPARRLGSLAVALLGLSVSSGGAAQDAARRIVPAPAFSGEDLAALPSEGWYTNGGNLLNQRYSPPTEINRDNVSGLKAVWRAP